MATRRFRSATRQRTRLDATNGQLTYHRFVSPPPPPPPSSSSSSAFTLTSRQPARLDDVYARSASRAQLAKSTPDLALLTGSPAAGHQRWRSETASKSASSKRAGHPVYTMDRPPTMPRQPDNGFAFGFGFGLAPAKCTVDAVSEHCLVEADTSDIDVESPRLNGITSNDAWPPEPVPLVAKASTGGRIFMVTKMRR
ncbi:unnamed protein product [Protopolystoma xenopodis]|uniref:Uncharacterized protein n=1 Tax=Protopolystoma xenopodis TaxID=117903 RepID=A0A448XQY3_9PLAT|nr:unnamed protein product [Protopolystoma xenopodis]